MAFRYVSVDEAMQAVGLRMVVVGNVPSPWGEAAKGIFHVKKLDWLAVRLDYESEALKAWAGQRSGPVAFWNAEPPRDRWIDILLLAERIAPSPALLPQDAEQRALAIGLAHEIIGEQGLAWSRRLRMVHAGLNESGGFAPPVAKYLSRKYGYNAHAADANLQRVVDVLALLTARLKAQHAKGSRYLIGDAMTAVDIYSAAAMALFRPLPEDVCAMKTDTRAAFGLSEPATDAALGDLLIAHRDMMYREHLASPLAL